jgi:tRNA-specific 2-thiouridylase
MSSKGKTVYVGMSGGVDSSVTAALLVEQGYNVTGVFMKNWAQDLPGFKCPWREDLADAKRVAVQLGIPFKIYDFQNEYKQKVVDYMITEYQAGRTPNPDIMCNQEVKFKLFLETALEDGADMIATGHYARIFDSGSTKSQSPLLHQGFGGQANSKQSLISNAQNFKQTHVNRHSRGDGNPVKEAERSELPTSYFQLPTSTFHLRQAVDQNKDQTYFLYRITEEALSKTLFPLGEMTKPEVRVRAKELGLITAEKKDSVGICFVGEIGIKEFLQNFVQTEPGAIIEKKSGEVVGKHEGAIFYTIGQRHGLNVGGGMPYYVVGKDMVKNEVYVTTDLNDGTLWQNTLLVTDVHWINGRSSAENYEKWEKEGRQFQVRTRHRAPLVNCTISRKDEFFEVQLKDEIRALTTGQSAVLYDGETCLGGGIIV